MTRKVGITKRVQAQVHADERRAAKTLGARTSTQDSFVNFAARVGIGTDNLSTASSYGFNPISRVRTLVEWMYRGSWIVGQVVDVIPEDMTKAGITLHGQNTPEELDQINKAIVDYQIWTRLQETIKWSRLYGGCLAVIMIDGQRPETPLNLPSVGRGSFMGLLVLDRWMVTPSLSDMVTDFRSTDLGLPKFYDVSFAAPAMRGARIHHSRCIRLAGADLPYWQRIAENMWGMSVLERLYDRLVAFDSGTQGASQLLYKAYIRTLKIPQLRDIVANGGAPLEGLLAQVNFMRQMQSNEGISVIDAADEFEGHNYTFAGVSDIILQMGQQLSGASGIPLVRLFGQSPAGLNATGESDLRNYYDNIEQRQETDLRRPLQGVLRIIAQSAGLELAPDFSYEFNPLWQLSDTEKAAIAKSNTETVLSADTAGIVPLAVILRELRQQSKVTNIWTNITDEDIRAAQLVPPPGQVEGIDQFLVGGKTPPDTPGAEEGAVPSGTPPVRDALPLTLFQGLPVMIETPRGERRTGDGWEVVMPAHYGYIRHTASAEGADEGMDCFIGPDAKAIDAYVIDQCDPATGRFDEHKVMLGFGDSRAALACYSSAYHDSAANRVMGVVRMPVDSLRAWLRDGDVSRALTEQRVARDRSKVA